MINMTKQMGFITKKNISLFYTKFSIYILWMAAVFDPIGTIGGWRYIALFCVYFALMMRVVVGQRFVLRADDFYTQIFSFFVLFLPWYGTFVYLFRGGFQTEFIDTAYLGAAVLFACSLIYLKDDLIFTGIKALILSQRLLSLIIVMTFISYANGHSLDWMYFFVEEGVAYIGKRNYSGFDFYYIYFIASPMIIFLMVYEICRFSDNPSLKIFMLASLPIIALFLSGTRVNMIMAIVLAPLVFFWRKWGVFVIFFGIFYLSILFVFLTLMDFDLMGSVFSHEEGSNSRKLNLLRHYGDIFNDPLTSIFGQGLNAQAWSESFQIMVGGKGSPVTRTELTYIEFFRVYGIFVSFIFMVIILLMLKNIVSLDPTLNWMAIAILVYMIGTSLNPYLFSSNGMLPLGLCAATLKVFKKRSFSRGNIRDYKC